MENCSKPSIPTLVPKPTMDSSTSRRMLLVMTGVLAPMVIAGWIVHASVDPPPAAAAAATLSEVADGHLVEIRDTNGSVVLSGEFRSRVDSVGNTEKDAELVGPQGQTVIGEVELEIPGPGRDHLRPELEVDVIHLRPNHRYTVVVDDRTVGQFLTDDRGSADLELQEGETLPGAGM